MPAPASLAPHLTARKLFHRYHACLDARQARRWQLLWFLASGCDVAEAAQRVGFSLRQAQRLVAQFNEAGPDGFERQRPRGRPRLLNDKQCSQLASLLEGPSPDGGLWTAPKVARWIEQQTGRPSVSRKVAWTYLQELGFSLRRGRPHHHQADEQAQEAFKKGSSRPPSARFVVITPKPRSRSGRWTSTASD